MKTGPNIIISCKDASVSGYTLEIAGPTGKIIELKIVGNVPVLASSEVVGTAVQYLLCAGIKF